MKTKKKLDYEIPAPEYDDDVIRHQPPVEEPEELPPPFTKAQIAFIEKMMEETIKRLAVEIRVREGDSYSWYSNNEHFNVDVALSYKHPDGPYNGEQISESSDSFTVRMPSTGGDF